MFRYLLSLGIHPRLLHVSQVVNCSLMPSDYLVLLDENAAAAECGFRAVTQLIALDVVPFVELPMLDEVEPVSHQNLSSRSEKWDQHTNKSPTRKMPCSQS